MKHLEHIVSAIIFVLGLSVSMAAFAYTSAPDEIIPEDTPDPDMSEITPVTVGDVTYLTGGIGKAESSAIRMNARNYALEIILVEKADGREEYISDVKIMVQDNNKNTVLDMEAKGPYVLANLPQGKYFINAEYKGEVKTQWVTVSKKKHAKVVFWWLAKPPSPIEAPATQADVQPEPQPELQPAPPDSQLLPQDAQPAMPSAESLPSDSENP